MPSFSSYTMSYIINNQSKRKHRLWFDVEEEYGTTAGFTDVFYSPLWFDVEDYYKRPVKEVATGGLTKLLISLLAEILSQHSFASFQQVLEGGLEVAGVPRVSYVASHPRIRHHEMNLSFRV